MNLNELYVDLDLPSGLLWCKNNVGAKDETKCGNFISWNDLPLLTENRPWRIPTKEEMKELVNETTHEYVTNFNDSGRNGCKFISKKNPDKYIFIPFAGWKFHDRMNHFNDDLSLWSSTQYAKFEKNAHHMYGFMNAKNYPIVSNCSKKCVMPTRSVMDKEMVTGVGEK